MIVVVGSPIGRETERGIQAAGMAATIGHAAAAAGGQVELVGKVAEGPNGDAVLLALARSGVGHVAVLRDASASTPIGTAAPAREGLLDDDASPTDEPPVESPRLDSGDLELALRYLPDYRVVVVADALDEAGVATVVAAARWSGAHLIVSLPPGSVPAGIPDDATVLEAPAADPDGAFGAVVGAYAAALDRGTAPADAFAAASAGSGWSTVLD